MMEFILMEQQHVREVARLEKECFSSPWSEAAVSAELSNPLSLWVVALDKGRVVGYVGSQSVLGEADMMNLAVDPAYRRQGIGGLLVADLVKRLQKNQVHSLTLEVRASNEAAAGLYEKLGFVQVGRRPGYYTAPKEDARILRKEWAV